MTAPWLLVLGANSDMALATARVFARQGYNIFLASRNLEPLQAEVDNLNLRFQVEAQALYFDALDTANHKKFYTELAHQPAGVLLAYGVMHDQASAQQDFNLARQTIETNYLSAVSILEIIAADFAKSRAGFMLAISSVAGDRGRASNYIYGSSKAALTAYLQGLAHRMSAFGVLVCNIKPGFVATKMTAALDLPTKLSAQPEEVGEAIFKAVKKQRHCIYVKPIWRFIMLIIISVPTFVFHKTKL